MRPFVVCWSEAEPQSHQGLVRLELEALGREWYPRHPDSEVSYLALDHGSETGRPLVLEADGHELAQLELEAQVVEQSGVVALEDAVVGLDDAEEDDLASRHPDRAGVAGHEAFRALLASERGVEHQPTAVECDGRSGVGLGVPRRHEEEDVESPLTVELPAEIGQEGEPLVRVRHLGLHLGEVLRLGLAQVDGERHGQRD